MVMAAKATTKKKAATKKASKKASVKKTADDSTGTKSATAKKATKKKAVKKKAVKKKAVKKKTVRKKKSAEPIRVKAFWGVFNHALKRVALYDYSQKRQAVARAKELSTGNKTPHFVQKVKEPVTE